MERFYLITNRAKDPDLTVTDQIRQYLEERGKTCLLCDNSEKGEKYHYTDPAKVPSDIDGILVLGGDVQDGLNVTVDINDSIDGLVMNVDKP